MPARMKHLQCRTFGALAVGGPALARMRHAYPVNWYFYPLFAWVLLSRKLIATSFMGKFLNIQALICTALMSSLNHVETPWKVSDPTTGL